MLHGSKEKFGIEFMLNHDHGRSWLYGKFCYWIAGTRVGNYDAGTSLRDVMTAMKYIVGDAHNRNGEALCGCADEDVFNSLNDSLYESSYLEGKPPIELPDMFARYNIKPDIEVFDGWGVYLLDCGAEGRILYKRLGAGPVLREAVSVDECDEVIVRAHENLVSLYNKYNC